MSDSKTVMVKTYHTWYITWRRSNVHCCL